MNASLTFLLFLFCVAKCYGAGFVTLSDVSLGSNCFTEDSVLKCPVTRGTMADFSCTFTLNASPIVTSMMKFSFTGEAEVTHQVCRDDNNNIFLTDDSCDHTDIPVGTYPLLPYPVLVSNNQLVDVKVFSIKLDVTFLDGDISNDYLISNLQAQLNN